METVTISLSHYDEMKKQIADLTKQVQEKTIVKEVYPAWYQFAAMAIGLFVASTFIMCIL